MKKQPTVTTPFIAAQLAELRELRGKDGPFKTAEEVYDELMDLLSDLFDAVRGVGPLAARKDAVKGLLVAVAVIAQRGAEDLRFFKREWVGGDDDA